MLVRFQPGPPHNNFKLTLEASFFIMEFFMDVAQALVGDVGVNLGGGNAGVAEQGLDRTDVSAVLQ